MQLRDFSIYTSPTKNDLQWQIAGTTMGHSLVKPGETYPRNRDKHPEQFKSVVTSRTLQEFQLIYITKGSGVFSTEGKQYEISPGIAFFLFPGVRHAYHPHRKTGWEEFWIGFHGAYANALWQQEILSPEEPLFHVGYHESIIHMFDQNFRSMHQQFPGYTIQISGGIVALITNIIGLSKQQQYQSEEVGLVDQVKSILEGRIFDSITIEELTEATGTGKSKLIALFSDYTGLSPYQYFLHMKINKAKQWLDMGLSVKEIAYRLSFQDPCYFSRIFTKKTGVSPTAWRVHH